MKLLIVDDQRSVVQGLVHCQDWAALGFDCVDTAYNAIEAKASLLAREAEVMLCDIEMPVESGLDLLKWVRDKQMRTRCIFLTAYAKFQYAQEAVRLGGFDYIMQPAPYEQVVEAVERALEEVQAERASKALQDKGAVLNQKKQEIAGNLLRDFLAGAAREQGLKAFEEIGLVPLCSQDSWLVLMQPLRWMNGQEPWDFRMLEMAIGNICGEIFEPLEVRAEAVSMQQEESLAVILQSRDGEELERDAIGRQLDYLQSVCRHYLHLSAAFYLAGPKPFSQAAQMWSCLHEQMKENVALKSGVYTEDAAPTGRKVTFHIHQIESWRRLLQEGYPQAMEQEVCRLMDKMVANNQMDRAQLRFFYQDFIQMIFTCSDDGHDGVRDMFQDPESMELYRNGMKTVDAMKALIHYVAASWKVAARPESGNVVETICHYIGEHLDEELRREDLAEVVHLNPDYLNRIFKKETGSTLKEYVIVQKMEEARSLLRTTNLPVSFIAAKVGYSNFAHFSTSYKKQFDCTPQEERLNRP